LNNKHLPEQYALALYALDTILKNAFEIMQNANDNREKLQALQLFKDTHLEKLSLLSNATTIEHALGYIRSKQQQEQQQPQPEQSPPEQEQQQQEEDEQQSEEQQEESESTTNAGSGRQSVFWWTTEEKLQAAKQSYSLAVAAAKLNERAPHLYDWVNWKCFKLDLLEKYRNSDLCDIGHNHISFLDNDKQTPASTVSFYHTNIPGVIMLQTHSYLGIPPSERNHWQQHEIPVTLKPERVE
jgi:cobalamin biosynthesis protein CobT